MTYVLLLYQQSFQAQLVVDQHLLLSLESMSGVAALGEQGHMCACQRSGLIFCCCELDLVG